MIARRAQLKASYQSQCHLAEKSMPNDFFATLYGLQLIVCSTVDYETLKNGILQLKVVISNEICRSLFIFISAKFRMNS